MAVCPHGLLVGLHGVTKTKRASFLNETDDNVATFSTLFLLEVPKAKGVTVIFSSSM